MVQNIDYTETNSRSDHRELEQSLLEEQVIKERVKLDRLDDQKSRLLLEWIGWAVLFRVGKDPAPREVEALEHIARLCRAAAVGCFVSGLSVAIYLTAGGVESVFWGAIGGLIGFVTATVFASLVVAVLNREGFIAKFRWGVWSSGLVIFGGMAGIVGARLPGSGEFIAEHPQLLTLSWLAVEFGSLCGTATCHLGAHYYGWSRRITNKYLAVEGKIREAELRIEKGTRRMDVLRKALPNLEMVAKVLVLAVLAAAGVRPLLAQCLGDFDDATSSMEPQRRAEAQAAFTEVAERHADVVSCVSVVRFSGAPPEQPRIFPLHQAAVQEPSVYVRSFKHVMEALEKQAVQRRKTYVEEELSQLRRYLSEPLPEPPCTSGADIAHQISAVMDNDGPAVLLTDGVFDCASPPRGGETKFESLFVFIGPHRGDTGSNFANAYETRKKDVERYLPGAHVYPSYVLRAKLEGAIANLGAGAE